MCSHEKNWTPSIKHRARPGMRAGSLAAEWPELATPLPRLWFVWFPPVCQRRLMFSFVGLVGCLPDHALEEYGGLKDDETSWENRLRSFLCRPPPCDGGSPITSLYLLPKPSEASTRRCCAACYLHCPHLNADSEARCEICRTAACSTLCAGIVSLHGRP